uniref:Uncharacterized protein n=1 Tax=Phlebotomus papatasi TaxID=29031 RepID=A0A1B0EXS4_PHLPP
MPIFSKKFAYKSAPARNRRVQESDCPRIHEKLEEFRNIHLQLDNEGGYTFANGSWTSNKNPRDPKSSSGQKLKEDLTKLSEENNLLQLKVEILVDLLTENTIEMNEIREKLMK